MTADLPLADELATVFARMSGLLLSRETVGTALRLLVSLAGETIPGVVGAGVTLIDQRGRETTAAASDAVVEQADALQYELNEGPCLAAWAQRETIRVDDIPAEERWPRWSQAAGALGLRSSLSVPLVAADEALGALKVYSDRRAAFPHAAEHRLRLFANQGAILVANVQSFEHAKRLSDGLREALQSRDVISTAKGILMARDGIDEETAFAMLVSVSQRENKKLREIAQDIVEANARRRRR